MERQYPGDAAKIIGGKPVSNNQSVSNKAIPLTNKNAGYGPQTAAATSVRPQPLVFQGQPQVVPKYPKSPLDQSFSKSGSKSSARNMTSSVHLPLVDNRSSTQSSDGGGGKRNRDVDNASLSRAISRNEKLKAENAQIAINQNLRLRFDNNTQIFLKQILKIEAPKNQRHRGEVITDFSKLIDIQNIKQRVQGMTDLSRVFYNQNQQRKDKKKMRQESKLKQQQMKGSKKYTVYDDSSSLSGDLQDEMSEEFKSKFPYPLCLSSIIIALQDILSNPQIIDFIKQDYKNEIIRLIQLCIQEQRCLMYKMPFFVLNFLTFSTFSNQYSRLEFLKMITKNGRIVNKAFNTKMFLVLINMIDPERLKDPNNNFDEIFEFLKTLFDCNPDCFSSSQSLILLTRICMVGISSMNSRPELTFEVLQIVQFLMKYLKQSTHNLKNLSLLALTIMITNPRLTMIAWTIVRNLIFMDPDRVVHEILEILMLGTKGETPEKSVQKIFRKTTMNSVQESDPLSQDQQILKELNMKCFNSKKTEFDEIELELQSKHKSCLINNFEEIDANLSIDELACKIECPRIFINNQQAIQIINFDHQQYRLFKANKFVQLKQKIQNDRIEFIETIERNLDKVKRGAVYILGMTKYGTDYVQGCTYSISRILDVFTEVLINTWNINLINEIIVSVSTLLQNKKIDLTFEWDQIMNIIDVLFKYHTKLLINNKKLNEIEGIFKHAQDKILVGKFVRDEIRFFKLYMNVRSNYMQTSMKFKEIELQIIQSGMKDQKKLREQYGIPKPNLTILSLYIDYVLFEEFENLDMLIINLFTNETNLEVKLLLLEKIHQYYRESQGHSLQQRDIEALMIEVFKMVFKINQDPLVKNVSNTNSRVQFKAIDVLAFMAFQCKDESRFYSIINILTQTAATDSLKDVLQQNHFDNNQNSYENQILSEMNPNQKQSLHRMIQIFKLKCSTRESYKSIYILNIFLEEFKRDSMDKREILFVDIIQNIRISKQGDFCWLTNDYPLMIGFKEFFKINVCTICEQSSEFEVISQKMVIPLSNLFETILSQLELGNDKTLGFKLKNLIVLKTLLEDLIASEDYLHQVQFKNDARHENFSGQFDFKSVIQNLLGHIDIETNFECSKHIYEILFIIIGSKNDQNAEVQSEIIFTLIKSIEQSFHKYDEFRDKSQDRKALRERIQMIFGDTEMDFGTRRDTLQAAKTQVETNKELSVEVRERGSHMVKKNDLEKYNLGLSHEYLLMLQKMLSFLGYYLQTSANLINLEEKFEIMESQRRNSSVTNYITSTPNRNLMNIVIETIYDLVRLDQLIHHISFQVISVIQGIQDKQVEDPFIFELSQLILFRLAMPKIIYVDEDFPIVTNKFAKGPQIFLKQMLMNSIQPIDVSTNIFSYQNSPQAQMLFDLVTTLQINFFSMKPEFAVYDVLQTFLAKIHGQFEYWLSNQIVLNFSVGFQQLFLNNLVDLFQWTLNSQQGQLKRHYLMSPMQGQKIDFFVLNQSLIQVIKIETRKFQLIIRNSAFNYEMIYEIQNPQQSQKNYSSITNKKRILRLLKDEPEEQPFDIDQKILMQAIHPIIMNEMVSKQCLFNIDDLNHSPLNSIEVIKTRCLKLCEKLDNIAPYNLNIAFISTKHCDPETSLDFISRLGNYGPLSPFKHYFRGNEFLEPLNGIVYDLDQSEIFIFISDIEPIDYDLLQNITTIFIGSLTPLYQDLDLDPKMSDFVSLQLQSIRIFQLNSSSYIISEVRDRNPVPGDQNEVSYILQQVPDQPLYDNMVIANEQVGKSIRKLVKERRMFMEQYASKSYRSPNMFQRQLLLKNFIFELKQLM